MREGEEFVPGYRGTRDCYRVDIRLPAGGTAEATLNLGRGRGSRRARVWAVSPSTNSIARNLTRTGASLGTPAYMSPEQAQGKEADRRSDLWSLGAVLYEIVTGQLPFRGDSEAAVVHSILHDDPERVTALRAGLPLELDRIIGKALAKDPGERYQHAEDFLVDMRTLRGRLQQESRAARRAAVATRRRGLFSKDGQTLAYASADNSRGWRRRTCDGWVPSKPSLLLMHPERVLRFSRRMDSAFS